MKVSEMMNRLFGYDEISIVGEYPARWESPDCRKSGSANPDHMQNMRRHGINRRVFPCRTRFILLSRTKERPVEVRGFSFQLPCTL